MGARTGWVGEFLAQGGWPDTPDNRAGVLAWIASEFGAVGQNNEPAHNLLATTLSTGDSVYPAFNSVGVQNYRSQTGGVAANVATVRESHRGYKRIRTALESGADAGELVDAVSDSVWGSHPSRELLSSVIAHPESYGGDGGNQPAPPEPVDVPPWPGEIVTLTHPFTTGNGIATWQAQMAARGWTIDVDDIFGPQSRGVLVAFQAEKYPNSGAVDGVLGPISWNAAWTLPVT